MQGSAIPVCLGNMDLDRTYYLDVGVEIVHVLYMAWGGESLYHDTPSIAPAALEHEKQRSQGEVACSVFHKDPRLDNMLWNVEKQQVMLIDFERSVVIQKKRKTGLSHVLDEVSFDAKHRRLITTPRENMKNWHSIPV